MKKKILKVLATLGVVALACGFAIKTINEAHVKEMELDLAIVDLQNEIEELNQKLKEKTNDYIEISDEMDELYEQVYNMQNGDPYEVTIQYGNETHTWSSDMKGLFPNHTHIVTGLNY